VTKGPFVNTQINPPTRLAGIITAILTPVHPDLSIDTDRLVAHAQDLLRRGGARTSTFGSTGEGVAFSAGEKRAAITALLDSGIRPDQLLPAIMTPSLSNAAEELADLAQLGCCEVLVLPPFYYKEPSLDGLVGFYEALYERAGRPPVRLVLYNIPALSGVTITHELVRRLQAGRGAPVIGIKDSTGDVESGLAYVRAFPELAIFTGDDRVLPHLLKAGGAGMIGGLPNLYVDDLVAFYRDPEGPNAPALAALAAERIAEIDRSGGILALKAELARQRGDDAWRRAMPPVDGSYRARQT
jgi:4-hydroxy-tetrahydrodipicolinate synthase